MNFNEYQEETRKTARYPDIFSPQAKFIYPAMGLCGEAGEVMEIVKKVATDKHFKLSWKDKQKIAEELGDALWYLSAIATEIGAALGWIAEQNLKKLERRYRNAPERG